MCVCVFLWNGEGIRLIKMKQMVTAREKSIVCVCACACVFVFIGVWKEARIGLINGKKMTPGRKTKFVCLYVWRNVSVCVWGACCVHVYV